MLFLLFIGIFLALWGVLDLVLPSLWRGLSSLANQAAATSMRYGFVQRMIRVTSPFRDYLPVIVIVGGGVLLAAWSGDTFMDVAEMVHGRSPALQKIDASAHAWAVARRYAEATTFFDVMTSIGGPAGVGPIAVLAFALLLWRKHFHRAVYLLVATGGGALLDWELKGYFARARPDVAEMLMQARGYSFPSGHAMGSTVVFGALAYIAFRSFRAWRWKAASLALAITLIVGVALSRVYLGVHWISDVGAGVVAGVLWVTVTTVGYETFRRIHLIRSVARQGDGGPTLSA